jgi:hypothetical protein
MALLGLSQPAPVPEYPEQGAVEVAAMAQEGRYLMLGPWASEDDIETARTRALAILIGDRPVAANIAIYNSGLVITNSARAGLVEHVQIIFGKPTAAIEIDASGETR